MLILQALQRFDHRSLLTMQRSVSVLAVRSRAVSRTADGQLYILTILLVAWFADSGDRFLEHALLAFSIERAVYWVLKNTLRRRRPADLLPGFRSRIVASDEFSFPSGHTCAAFLFVTLLCAHFGLWLLPLYGWAAMVGMSRIYLGVHFPTDTVVGAALGVALALATAVHYTG